MTQPTVYLVLAAGLFCLSQLTIAVWTGSQARRLRLMAKHERLRGQFAVARNKLIWLAVEGKLPHQSQTFQRLYIVQTRMMRGFDAYPTVSEAFWSNLLDGNLKADGALARESANWSEDTRAVVERTADALHAVWFGCMPFKTALDLTSHLVAKVSTAAAQSLTGACLTFLSKLKPDLGEVRATEEILRRRLA